MQNFKDYFNFNKRQERGVFVLSLILIMSILLNYLLPRMISDTAPLPTQSMYLQQLATASISPKKSTYSSTSNKERLQLNITKDFDPNFVSKEELLSIGLNNFVVDNMLKYRKNGGLYYSSKDVAKIYGMKAEWHQQLEPFIKISPPKKQKIKWRKSKKTSTKEIKSKEQIEKPPPKINIYLGINTADSVALLAVNGIGPFYAGSIVKYRKRLGGYTNINQLMDLYKMDSTKFLQWKEYLFVDSVEIRKIDINKVAFKSLLKHPYVDYETTKYILNKRKSLGKYAALYELKDTDYMPDELFEKLKPYLSTY
ncbi:MAG: hypothetical protein B7C24_13025 [Bacteroidetes bacterium 4572_77]|nr:MAG: hypothetical protein B7C24_13025 [Bacteroidetes bacterium 4572_77]